jgi:hypothetical protein
MMCARATSAFLVPRRAVQWTFEQAAGPVISGAQANNTWTTSGVFHVQLTATDSLGRQTVDSFTVPVGDVPPVLTLYPAPPSDDTGCVGFCNIYAVAVGSTTALELHERVGSPAGVAFTLAQQVELLAAAGIHAPAPRMVARGFDAAERASARGHCVTQIYAASIRSRLAAGDDAGAATTMEAARVYDATCPPCPVCRVDLYEAFAAYALEFGELDLAQSYVDLASPLADWARNHPGRARLGRARGQIHAARGEMADAERCLLEAADSFQAVGDMYDLALTLQTLATCDGRQDRAELLRQAEVTLAAYRSVPLAAITGA